RIFLQEGFGTRKLQKMEFGITKYDIFLNMNCDG
uniref:GNAT family N-acetyltransferase n=1 Tax=Panagrolaimus sp. JU765 TaxID=591449 RepID=A0AC34R6Z0_9BILA